MIRNSSLNPLIRKHLYVYILNSVQKKKKKEMLLYTFLLMIGNMKGSSVVPKFLKDA